MISQAWSELCHDLLGERGRQGLLRQRQILEPVDATHVSIDGTTYVNFSSNNYLGLTHHPKILQAARRAWSVGSGASGLITGYTQVHAAAEKLLARWKGTESAVLLPSGYQANLAAIQTLAAIGDARKGGTRFLVDKLSHASVIDAVRSTESLLRVFPHNGLAKLRRLLEEADPQQLQVVLTESIFSMDGDAADLTGLFELKQTHPFVLVLDEAHASGVYGDWGAGLAAELRLQHAVDVSIVTLSKALGCVGGAVCCSEVFRDALINFGRAYIYSTSVPPSLADCVIEAIKVMRDEPHRQSRVRELARRVRAELAQEELPIPPGDSPIVPVVVGTERAAMEAAERLKREQMLVMAVRPPTVPPGSSRLRISLCCEHTDAEVRKLIDCVKALSIAYKRHGR